MNKKIVLLIAVLVFSVGFLSGCNESSQTSGDTDKVELASYEVKTEWYELESGSNTGIPKEENGFFHDFPPEVTQPGESGKAGSASYYVSGYVKNIAGELLHKITVTGKFCDVNGNVLYTDTDDVWDTPNSYTGFFELSYSESKNSYFENVDQIKFEFTVS